MSRCKHFDFFWKEAIVPAIEKCFKELDPEFLKLCDLKQKNLDEYRFELEDRYKHKREWLKSKYLPHMDEPMLDFHKLGSIICRCIIGNKPFIYDVDTAEILMEKKNQENISHEEKINWNVANVYINYKVAFLAGMGIAFADLIYWSAKKADSAHETNPEIEEIYLEFYKELNTKGYFSIYPHPLNHENFDNSVILALMKGDLLKRDFDYLFFSVILYQVQENTKLYLLNDILEKHDRKFSEIELV